MSVRLGAALPAAFAAALRQGGFEVSSRSVLTFTEALAMIDLDRREQVFWAARASFVTRPEDFERFTSVFDAFFGGRATLDLVEEPDEPDLAPAALDASGTDAHAPVQGIDDADSVRFSAREILATKDFAHWTEAELAELSRLVGRLRLDPPMRPSRRRRRVVGPVGRFDLPATAHHALRTLGEPIHIGRTRSSERPRRLVLLLDVSGSMDAYSRALLRFAHAASVSRNRVEVFALGTRLTRLTRELRSHDPDAALTRAVTEIVDHGGGTRLGETLREFNDHWGVRGLARGATVVVCSDGWDRGDPTLLGAQVERLSRVTHRLVWMNPLKASPGYVPLAGGMAAALPHLDNFVAGHSLDALEHLAELVAA